VGVISTLGAFGSNAHMRRVCGDLNEAVFEAAAAAHIPRAVFISVHPFGFPAFVLPGYFGGKQAAEETLFRLFPTGGVALRPGFVYGTRHVGSAGLGLPLGAVGAPLEAALSALGPVAKTLAAIPLAGAAFVPPVSVDAVARAAVAAATDPAVVGGPMSVWELRDRFGGGGEAGSA
jgi:nucleoside-diphosphate-sugar epimerase